MNNDLKKILRDLRKNKETPVGIQLHLGEDGAMRLRGEPGYTPQKGVDYWTREEINEIVETIFKAAKPNYGVDYYTESDKRKFVEEVLKMATPIKGVHYRDGIDGKPGKDGKDAEEIDARKVAIDAINFLETFEGDARLSAKALKDLDGAVTEILQKGFDFELSEKQINTIKDLMPKYPPINAGGSGATFLKSLRDVDLSGLTKNADGKYILGGGSGASTFLSLSDTPSAYTGQGGKSVTVKSDESGLEFTTPAGTGIVQTIVAGTGISVDNTDPANPVVSATTGGSGITRSISSISTPTTAGATTSTDYVYNITNTTLTLPTAVGNTNQYTVKCISGTCVVEGHSSETIEGALNITIQVEDSVDLISNNTEWKVV